MQRGEITAQVQNWSPDRRRIIIPKTGLMFDLCVHVAVFQFSTLQSDHFFCALLAETFLFFFRAAIEKLHCFFSFQLWFWLSCSLFSINNAGLHFLLHKNIKNLLSFSALNMQLSTSSSMSNTKTVASTLQLLFTTIPINLIEQTGFFVVNSFSLVVLQQHYNAK